jgi:hypothetical protein
MKNISGMEMILHNYQDAQSYEIIDHMNDDNKFIVGSLKIGDLMVIGQNLVLIVAIIPPREPVYEYIGNGFDAIRRQTDSYLYSEIFSYNISKHKMNCIVLQNSIPVDNSIIISRVDSE